MDNEKKTPKNSPFQIEDRVRVKDRGACLGTVQFVRAEITQTKIEPSPESLMVNVLWDNGTCSYFAPQALEKVS